jgi:hypothetical protein
VIHFGESNLVWCHLLIVDKFYILEVISALHVLFTPQGEINDVGFLDPNISDI